MDEVDPWKAELPAGSALGSPFSKARLNFSKKVQACWLQGWDLNHTAYCCGWAWSGFMFHRADYALCSGSGTFGVLHVPFQIKCDKNLLCKE